MCWRGGRGGGGGERDRGWGSMDGSGREGSGISKGVGTSSHPYLPNKVEYVLVITLEKGKELNFFISLTKEIPPK